MKSNDPIALKGRLERSLLETLDFYRGVILDLSEQSHGESPEWPFVRNRLLKALGERGLGGRIKEVLNSELGV